MRIAHKELRWYFIGDGLTMFALTNAMLPRTLTNTRRPRKGRRRKRKEKTLKNIQLPQNTILNQANILNYRTFNFNRGDLIQYSNIMHFV